MGGQPNPANPASSRAQSKLWGWLKTHLIKLWVWIKPHLAKLWQFFWTDQTKWKKWQHVMGVLSAIFFLYSLQFARHEFTERYKTGDGYKLAQAIFLGIWIIVPPIWFWFEYYFLYEDGKPGLDEFKHGQGQSSKIWLALITLLAATYFGKDFIREASPPCSDIQQPTESQRSTPTPASAPSTNSPSLTPAKPSPLHPLRRSGSSQ